MVRINKVYTKTGDRGETRLASGERIAKDHPRIEAYGTVDELNSLVGIVRCFNLQKPDSELRNKLELILLTIQQRLFDLGGELASKPAKNQKRRLSLSEANVHWLEEVIDAMNEELQPLKSFTLPGGGPVCSFLHQCRTVCRRAERQMVALARQEEIGPWTIPYINRLADAFFVFSRWAAHRLGEEEPLWEPGQPDPDNWRWESKP
ncbi:MAG: cob(I)yrinic acid a,c-diamide adenosyltransferase [Nitrospinales bacterium]